MVAITPTPTPPGHSPSVPSVSPAPTQLPASGSAITTPQAFLRALVVSDFDFPATAAATPIDLLMQFVKDPTVQAELAKYTSLSNICLELRQAHFHSLAMTELAEVMHQAEDPTERRRAATALLRATRPAKPPVAKAAAQEDPDEAGSHEAGPDEAEEEATTPVPSPTTRPSAALTVQQVIDKLIEAAENLNAPTENAGLSTLAAFCDDDAEFNGEPLPTDSLAACVETFAETEITQIPACDRRTGPEDLAVSGDTATCSIQWRPSAGMAPLILRLTLKRAPISRCPDAWLITSLKLSRH